MQNEFTTETVIESQPNWNIKQVVGDGENIAWYGERNKPGQRGCHFVFVNGRRLAGPGCFPAYADVWNFQLVAGLLVFTAGWRESRSVFCLDVLRRGIMKQIGPFLDVQSLAIKNDRLYFVARTEEGLFVYQDDQPIGGPYRDLSYGELRLAEQERAIYYLAMDATGYALYKNGQPVCDERFEKASCLLVSGSAATFVTTGYDEDDKIRYGAHRWNGQKLVSYWHDQPSSWVHDRGCGQVGYFVNDGDVGCRRYVNGELIDATTYRVGGLGATDLRGQFAALRGSDGQSRIYNLLYDEVRRETGPHDSILQVRKVDGDYYFVAADGPIGREKFHLWRNNDRLAEVGSDFVRLRLMNGIPVVTFTAHGAWKVVNVAGQRIGRYSCVSEPFWRDGKLSFYAVSDDGEDDILLVQVDVSEIVI